MGNYFLILRISTAGEFFDHLNGPVITITAKPFAMKNNRNLVNSIRLLAERSQQLALQAHAAYEPLVTDIIKHKRTDQKGIEHLLDGLLDFCFDDSILLLYRKLCRYYFDLNQQATADYIKLYREMWDEEGKMNFKKKN